MAEDPPEQTQAPTITREAIENVEKEVSPKRQKRKAPAGGNQKHSMAWDHFIKVEENGLSDPTTECNHFTTMYMCNLKTHGASNLVHHLSR